MQQLKTTSSLHHIAVGCCEVFINNVVCQIYGESFENLNFLKVHLIWIENNYREKNAMQWKIIMTLKIIIDHRRIKWNKIEK